jgi:hypothetical protein
MNSALGNFNNDGARLEDGVDVCFERLHTRIVALEDLLAQQGYKQSPIVSERYTVLTDKFIKEEIDTLLDLISAMLANGASLYELQQRIMGLG